MQGIPVRTFDAPLGGPTDASRHAALLLGLRQAEVTCLMEVQQMLPNSTGALAGASATHPLPPSLLLLLLPPPPLLPSPLFLPPPSLLLPPLLPLLLLLLLLPPPQPPPPPPPPPPQPPLMGPRFRPTS